MIRLADRPLSHTALLHLSDQQAKVDALTDYAERVAEAKRLWDGKSRTAFAPILTKLRQMNGRLVRCSYCEDSCADEIEHIYPKTLYPDRAFVWDNYLYSCGLCNPEKRDKFAVFSGVSHAWEDIQRKRGAAVIAPTAGDPVLIDPRREDPLVFLYLDIRDTFRFFPAAPKGTREHARADYTIDALGLNTRDVLPRCRKNEYGSYRAKLREFIHKRDAGVSARDLRLLTGALKRSPHRTVWKEMQRQANRIPELSQLFEAAPEALSW